MLLGAIVLSTLLCGAIGCPPGSHGNDCSFPCGHCVGGRPCDRYTGRCVGCEPGYVPPYCYQESVYYPSKPQVSSTEYGKIAVSFNLNNAKGYGQPNLYQIQYRKKVSGGQWHTYTSKAVPPTDDSSREYITEIIDNVEPGVLYEVRVLLVDDSLNKYDGPLVQTSEILSKCFIPRKYDYNITSVRNMTSLTFSWSYVNESVFWCPVESYEVTWLSDEEKRLFEDVTSEAHKVFGNLDLSPSRSRSRSRSTRSISIWVRAKTSAGYAPGSSEATASTEFRGSPPVQDLRRLYVEATEAKLSWNPPLGSNGSLLQYKVTYKCEERPMCPDECQDAAEEEVTVTDTSVVLSPLLPFTSYKASVTPEGGKTTIIYLATPRAKQTEGPTASSLAPIRTNTSLTVFWDQVPVCSDYFEGFYYHLVKASESDKVVDRGYTMEKRARFHNLTASTDYVIKVFLRTEADSHPTDFLPIAASTTAN